MRSMLLVTMLALGTVLAAGAAQAGPSVSVDCGRGPDEEIRVDSDGHEYRAGPASVEDGPGASSRCPIQAAIQADADAAPCYANPVAYTTIWTVYVYQGSCYGVVLTDEKNPATFRCPSAEDAPCTIGVVV